MPVQLPGVRLGVQCTGDSQEDARMGSRTDEQWVTLSEAAKRLGKDASTLRKHLAQNHFPSRKTALGWHEVPWLEVQAFYARLAGQFPGQVLPRSQASGGRPCSSQEAPGSDAGRVAELQDSLARERERSDRLEKLLVDSQAQSQKAMESLFVLSREVSILSRQVVALLPAPASEVKAAEPQKKAGATSHAGDWMPIGAAADVLGIPRQTLASRAKKGSIASREENGRKEVFIQA